MLKEIFSPKIEVPPLTAEHILSIGNSWPISNSTTFLIFITFLFFIFAYASKKFKSIPGFFQSIFEMLLESIENLLKSLAGGKEKRVKELLFPITAIFLIVGSINILGSFPIIGQVTWVEESGKIIPFFRKATSDLNVTIPLALAIVLSMQYFGVKNWGFIGYFKRFFPVHILIKESKKGIGGFFLGLIEMFIAVIELISEGIKVVSLSLRLFGNMFAGEIVFAIITSAIAIAIPVIWIGFDLVVAIIQTLVIGCLTTVYYMMVVKEEGQSGH